MKIAGKYKSGNRSDGFKEKVVNLLKRVCTVSIKTMENAAEMGK
jgi:hypothetical protein